jgi:glutaminase
VAINQPIVNSLRSGHHKVEVSNPAFRCKCHYYHGVYAGAMHKASYAIGRGQRLRFPLDMMSRYQGSARGNQELQNFERQHCSKQLKKLQTILDDVAERAARSVERGRVASYIPELAKVDPAQFGIAVADAQGQVLAAGDADVAFSIQSVSKVFALTLALEQAGETLWQRVGREPSGDPFNSIVQLEHEGGIPRNPLINAGAIVVADVILAGRTPIAAYTDIVNFVRRVAEDDDIRIDPAVADSEANTGFRNAAMANFMRAYGNLDHDPRRTLEVYFHQCSIAMTCAQLAKAGRYLAFDGCITPLGPRVVSTERARRINALMLTCGHYDGSGDFAFRVGLPGKSGVGGGILAIVPGQCAVAVWSPGLNKIGNSYLGSSALTTLAAETGWSVFGTRVPMN